MTMPKNMRQRLRQLTSKRHPTDTPWTASMATSYQSSASLASNIDSPADDQGKAIGEPLAAPEPTVAAFSPNQQTASTRSRNASSILIHHKTPLLVATPPQVTRALAYSHPFILPLNHLAGLLTWTTGDQWESFLLLTLFLLNVLYGDYLTRWIGPVVLVSALIAGMYSRRYSPLSSTVWSGEPKGRKLADSESRKSLDEILDTLQTFTKRCDVLLEPFLRLTDFLSTQSSPTSATTRPALTTLFTRILALTPIWYALSMPPLRIITTQRVVLVMGTIGLTWHSRPARVTRTILWRSRTIRAMTAQLTGLRFKGVANAAPALPPRRKIDAKGLASNGTDGAVRFTFTLFENQRRWLGIGWTSGMLLHERQAWADEHNYISNEPKDFKLPVTDSGSMKWQWAPDSEWHIEGAPSSSSSSATEKGGKSAKNDDNLGWTYFDWQWHDPRKSDTWGRYTRRRKWTRDAELVDNTAAEAETTVATTFDETSIDLPPAAADSIDSPVRKKGWFARRQSNNRAASTATIVKSDGASASGSGSTGETVRSRDGSEEDVHQPHRYRNADWDRSIGEGLAEGLS